MQESEARGAQQDSRLFRESGAMASRYCAVLRMKANYMRLSAITHVGWTVRSA